jgi:hypothetical protein
MPLQKAPSLLQELKTSSAEIKRQKNTPIGRQLSVADKGLGPTITAIDRCADSSSSE